MLSQFLVAALVLAAVPQTAEVRQQCGSIGGVEVTDVVGAKQLHFCDVKGVIAPKIHYEVKLPVSGWHGQYLQEGCDAFCGTIPNLSPPVPPAALTCAPVLNGEMVVAADDEGHSSLDPGDGSWAKDDLTARVVFGRTSEHQLAQVAKSLITRYYGRPPEHSYYDGCSTGGREALVLAQHYPDDFDGIIAGAPAGNMAPLTLFAAWLARSNTDAAGHQVITAEKLPALHEAVLHACGNGDPRLCTFDPNSVRCPDGVDTNSCLTPPQVAAVRAFYLGPRDPQGRSLYNGGEPYGSELAWRGEMVQPAADAAAPGDTFAARISSNYLKYLDFPGTTEVRFTDAEFARLDVLGRAIYNANNPDLRAFRAHGGKLILYHGLADQSIPPWSTVDYYAAVERQAGGFVNSQSFSRMYLIPGAFHCLFGPDGSVNLADFLTPLISWVEQGTAPGVVAAPTWPSDQPGGLEVTPQDALVQPSSNGLNSHYDYIGAVSSYLP